MTSEANNKRVVLITGSSRGIGRSLAIGYAKHGYLVVVNYNHSEKEALDVLSEIQEFNGIAICFKADVSEREDVQKLKKYILEAYGRIDESATSQIKVEVISLDQFVQENHISKIDFIKMDIEEAEYQALIGAKKILQMQKPKLAICIYHKFDDLWSIPLLIKTLNPKYSLYMGHHSQNLFDTVIYAI